MIRNTMVSSCSLWGVAGANQNSAGLHNKAIKLSQRREVKFFRKFPYTSQENHDWMHIFQRVYDRIITLSRHSVLVKKAYFSFAKRVTHRDRERTRKGKKGKRVGDRQEKWNKKRLNFWTRKNNYCTSGLHLVNILTSGFIWPLGPEHFPVSPWILLQTCPSLNVEKRGESPPFFLSKLPLTNKKLDPMIHSFSASVIFCSPSSSLPRSNGSCFSFCDKSSAIVVGFSALSSTGKKGDNTKNKKPAAF